MALSSVLALHKPILFGRNVNDKTAVSSVSRSEQTLHIFLFCDTATLMALCPIHHTLVLLRGHSIILHYFIDGPGASSRDPSIATVLIQSFVYLPLSSCVLWLLSLLTLIARSFFQRSHHKTSFWAGGCLLLVLADVSGNLHPSFPVCFTFKKPAVLTSFFATWQASATTYPIHFLPSFFVSRLRWLTMLEQCVCVCVHSSLFPFVLPL